MSKLIFFDPTHSLTYLSLLHVLLFMFHSCVVTTAPVLLADYVTTGNELNNGATAAYNL